MDLTPFVDRVRTDLLALADTGDPQVKTAAERLALALDPSLRMALLAALSEAAAEISTQVPSGSVEVRLRGSHPEFVVDVPPPVRSEQAPFVAPAAVGDDSDDTDDDVVRVTVRVPSQVKRRAEELAGSTGRSLNSWIVTALRAATRDEGWAVDLANLVGDLTRNPPGQWGGPGRPGRPGRSGRPGDSGAPGDTNLSGWI